MKLSEINPTPANLSDWSDVAALQQRLAESVEAMSRMAAAVGMAKHVLEYDGDQRKRALARAMAPALAGGASAAKAEVEGRTSETYAKELAVLAKAHQSAATQIVEWEVTKLQWQTAQSLLAMQRESVKRL